MKISAMILCGYYEPYLKYCIESTIPVADEIVILAPAKMIPDLQKQYMGVKNIKILTQKGEETNYAAWRNQILDNCTGDWIFWLDADEIMSFTDGSPISKENIIELTEQKPEVDTFRFFTRHFLYNYFTLDARNNSEHWSLRLFKNNNRRFRRKVHEYIQVDKGKSADVTNPIIWHFGHCKGMEDLRDKYEKTGKVKDNPYGTRDRKENNSYCSKHDLFLGTRPIQWYRGHLPSVMRLW